MVINADKVNRSAYVIAFVVTEHINPKLHEPSANLEEKRR